MAARKDPITQVGELAATLAVVNEHVRVMAAAPAMRAALERLIRDARPLNWLDDDDPDQRAAWITAARALQIADGQVSMTLGKDPRFDIEDVGGGVA